MGIDAQIFAKNSKKRLYFDRLYNIESYWDLDLPLMDFEILDFIYYKLKRNKDEEGCSRSETVRLINACKKAWIDGPEEDRYHMYWNECILKFIEQCGDDVYFVISDNQEEYSDILDKYEEIKYEYKE